MAYSSFEELRLNTRTKLVALWTALMFLYIYGDYFKLYIPGETNKLVTGNTLLDTPERLFAASVLLAIPPLVIIFSVMAPARVARVLNIIFGLVFTAIMLLIAVTSVDIEWASYVFYALLESIITIVIIRQAWSWPKINN